MIDRTLQFAKRFVRDEDGAFIVEFAITFPVLILLSFGLLEFSLVAFDYQRAAEATRRGVRLAVIQEPIPNTAQLLQDKIITCTAPGGIVECVNGTPSLNANALFDALLKRMQQAYPALVAENVIITFEGTKVGAVEDTGGVFPLITLQLANVQHQLIVLHIFGVKSFEYPDFKTTVLGNGKWVNTAPPKK